MFKTFQGVTEDAKSTVYLRPETAQGIFVNFKNAFCGFALLMVVLFDYGYKYYRNPLADTRVSSSFKPLNVPELKEGMSKDDVLELLGEPLEKLEDEFVYAKRNGIGWYEYLCLDVYFENDIVKKIDKRWEYED